MSDAPVIEAKGLNLWYGPNHALKNISVSIPAHEITAFIGPSGCGKSTFLRTLNRINDLIPNVKITGEVYFNGENIYAPNVDVTRLRSEIGMVFQKANPFPMSIYDNVAYGPRTHGVRSRAKLDEIVENSLRSAAIWDEVKDRLKKSALGLSGGQQQRLCIARALAVEPEVLLSPQAHSIPSRPRRSRIWRGSSRIVIRSSWSRTICSRRRAFRTIPPFSCSASWWSSAKRSRSFPRLPTSGRRTTSRGGLDN